MFMESIEYISEFEMKDGRITDYMPHKVNTETISCLKCGQRVDDFNDISDTYEALNNYLDEKLKDKEVMHIHRFLKAESREELCERIIYKATDIELLMWIQDIKNNTENEEI